MLSGERTSTGMAEATPLACKISRVTVVMVEEALLGSGGKEALVDESDKLLPDTTTALGLSGRAEAMTGSSYLCNWPWLDR